MDTAEALTRAMEALKEAGVPESLWPTAFPLAFADVRGEPSPSPRRGQGGGSSGGNGSTGAAKRTTKKSSSDNGSSGVAVLSDLPDQDELFARIAAETNVSADDLGDVFYVSDGKLHLKVASKDLGGNVKASAMTVTSLLAGVVFAGTDHKSLPINEVHEVCRSKRCYHEKNGSTYVKATPSIATVGSPRALEITHKTGWQDEFASAIGRVLGKGDGVA